jgi:hypothetical protein
MPMPLSALLSLQETVQFAVERTGEAVNRICAALTDAALKGELVATGCRHNSALDPARSVRYYATYFGHSALSDREIVPPSAWGGPISWPKSRVGRYDLVIFERSELERWLGSAETDPQSDPTPQQAIDLQVIEAAQQAGMPAAADMPTGAPGRPTKGMHLIRGAFGQRAATNVCAATLHHEAAALHQWFRSKYPESSPPTVKTIENNIRADYRQWRGAGGAEAPKL